MPTRAAAPAHRMPAAVSLHTQCPRTEGHGPGLHSGFQGGPGADSGQTLRELQPCVRPSERGWGGQSWTWDSNCRRSHEPGSGDPRIRIVPLNDQDSKGQNRRGPRRCLRGSRRCPGTAPRGPRPGPPASCEQQHPLLHVRARSRDAPRRAGGNETQVPETRAQRAHLGRQWPGISSGSRQDRPRAAPLPHRRARTQRHPRARPARLPRLPARPPTRGLRRHARPSAAIGPARAAAAFSAPRSRRPRVPSGPSATRTAEGTPRRRPGAAVSSPRPRPRPGPPPAPGPGPQRAQAPAGGSPRSSPS